MLLAENRGWAEDGDLPALLHHLERRADRNLCLAESHVATHQAVHGPWKLEVTLGVLNRQVLARGLHPWEGLLHFPLEGSVRGERAAFPRFALGVQLTRSRANSFASSLAFPNVRCHSPPVSLFSLG